MLWCYLRDTTTCCILPAMVDPEELAQATPKEARAAESAPAAADWLQHPQGVQPTPAQRLIEQWTREVHEDTNAHGQ